MAVKKKDAAQILKEHWVDYKNNDEVDPLRSFLLMHLKVMSRFIEYQIDILQDKNLFPEGDHNSLLCFSAFGAPLAMTLADGDICYDGIQKDKDAYHISFPFLGHIFILILNREIMEYQLTGPVDTKGAEN